MLIFSENHYQEFSFRKQWNCFQLNQIDEFRNIFRRMPWVRYPWSRIYRKTSKHILFINLTFCPTPCLEALCLARWSALWNGLKQISQISSDDFKCNFKCWLRWSLRLKHLVQISHTCGLSSECDSRWRFKWLGRLNPFWHSSHLYTFSWKINSIILDKGRAK